jgi:hypothetical protein
MQLKEPDTASFNDISSLHPSGVISFKHDPTLQKEQLIAHNWYMLYSVRSAAHTYRKAKNAHSTPLQQTNDTTIWVLSRSLHKKLP